MKPGDLLLVHSDAPFNRLIKFGEWLHRKNASCWTTHIGCIVSEAGDTIEAEAKGVIRSNVSAHAQSKVIDTGFTDEQRARAVAFAESCVGDEYGFLTLASIALHLLLPFPLSFKSSKSLICSELGARFAEHAGWICPELDTARVMPSDIDFWFLKEVVA